MEAGELPRIVLEKSRGRYHSPVGRRLPGTSRADLVLLPQAAKRLHCDLGFLVGLWGGFSVCDTYFDLPQHRHDLLCFVPFDRHVAAQAFLGQATAPGKSSQGPGRGLLFLYCENGGLLTCGLLTCGRVPLFLALFDEENHSSLSGLGPEPRQIVFKSVPERDAVARAEIFLLQAILRKVRRLRRTTWLPQQVASILRPRF
jgi:hypothetical protein